MIPFALEIRPGLPFYEQVILGVKRALVAGELKPGDAFPSLRSLAMELRVNPNTAAKVVTLLKQEGILEAIPGVGMVVARDYAPRPNPRESAQVIGDRLLNLIIEARHLGLTQEAFLEAARKHWQAMNQPE